MLATDPVSGLTPDEARARLARFGPNSLPAPSGQGVWRRLLSQFNHPLIYVLLVSGAVTALLGETVDSGVIFGVVLVNAAVGFVQESRAESALDSLRALVRTRARVVRDGRPQTIGSEELVPGDLVELQAGDLVPADLRLVRAAELRADESALTGESLPVVKDEVVLPAETPVADRRNILYSGTLITAGSGSGVAVATGSDTELGEIHRLVGSAASTATPLTRKLARFSRLLVIAIILLAALTFLVGLARGENAAQMFTASVALAVGAIPEGLPAAVTITLAIGVARMARRRAVVRHLPAVETLGSTTVICTDKTGTLTENQMTVEAVWTPDGIVQVTGTGYAPEGGLVNSTGQLPPAADGTALRWCLTAGALCNDSSIQRRDGSWHVVGDPTEAALLVSAAKGGLIPERLGVLFPRVAAIPFSSAQQFMATLHRHPDGGLLVVAKGGAERLLNLCGSQFGGGDPNQRLDHQQVMEAVEGLTGGGSRVLAAAVGWIERPEQFSRHQLTGRLSLVGLQAMADPLRPEAAAAVHSCLSAGVAVKMITGDHPATAAVIATELGLLQPGTKDHLLTGSQLAALPAAALPAAVDRASVFARVSPEQKLQLVEALQSRGQVVAMTGDGVNDAPALRQADVGVAMGRGGTEVAKDAADVVLLDDDFASIEAAIEEGRGIYDNLVKFIVWTIPTNMGEALVIVAAVLLGASLPVLPVQVLWINMTTAVALGLMLAFEPKEAGLMQRPPRDPSRPLLTGSVLLRTVIVSALLVAGAWWLFEWERTQGASLAAARTTAMNLFVAVEALYLFSCRSLTRGPWSIGFFSNRWVLGGVAVQAVAQAGLTYIPAMNHLFQTAPISLGAWLRIAGAATVTGVVVALLKRLRGLSP